MGTSLKNKEKYQCEYRKAVYDMGYIFINR